MATFVYILLGTLFLFLIAVFAGTETGFVCLDVQLLRTRAQLPANTRERALLRIVQQPEKFLALTLLGINMSLVIATSIFTNVFQNLGPGWVTIGTTADSLFIFLFCELLPKIAFNARPMDLSLRFLPLIGLFDRLMYFPVLMITGTTRFLMGRFGLRNERAGKKISRGELLILLHLGASSGAIREKPHKMARGIIGLKDRNVAEVMIPRVRISALDVSMPLEKARKSALECGYSRIPVFEGTIDQIIGVVYFKDLFLKSGPISSLRDVMIPPLFVPEMKNAHQLLQEMRKRKFHLAVVLDEYGSPSGIVTLEDLIEEFVGEIHDELDEPMIGVKLNPDGTMTIRGDLSLVNLQTDTGITFSLTQVGITTLNGIIVSQVGRIPQAGECILIEGYKFEVLSADARCVLSVRFFP